MNDEIKEILTISGRYITNDEKGLILDCITNLQKEISHLRQNKARTLEYIENNRIREKCIVDVNTLEGLLNE